jgi:DNA-binding NarL/FixJ family response regulator
LTGKSKRNLINVFRRRAFKLGALGFIPKTTEREIMLNAIKLVFSGGIYIPSECRCVL